MLLRNVQHKLQFLRSEDGAGGVAGVGDKKGTGMLIDAGLDAGTVGVEVALFDRGRDRMNLRSGQRDRGVVVGVEGLGDDDLVPVVQDRGKGHLQSFTAAGGGQNIPAFQLHTDALVIITHRINIDRQTARRRIGNDLFVKVLQSLVEGGGRFDVRLADVQMVDFDTAFLGLLGIGVELAHGGEPAAFHFR